MENVQLSMDNNLGIQLSSVTFQDANNASAVFTLFSDGHNVRSSQHVVATLTQEVPRYNLEKTDLPDYNRIVEAAAKKLECDFQRVVEMLTKSYSSP